MREKSSVLNLNSTKRNVLNKVVLRQWHTLAVGRREDTWRYIYTHTRQYHSAQFNLDYKNSIFFFFRFSTQLLFMFDVIKFYWISFFFLPRRYELYAYMHTHSTFKLNLIMDFIQTVLYNDINIHMNEQFVCFPDWVGHVLVREKKIACDMCMC